MPPKHLNSYQIPKKEITASAKFYPYKLDSVLIEVLALRAPDGTADANNITIAKSLFVEAKPIFLNWKTR